MALREGKIAHVIHHFSIANRLAETPSLRRWTQGETEYFSHLNSDDEYMELEISRVNMLETVESSKENRPADRRSRVTRGRRRSRFRRRTRHSHRLGGVECLAPHLDRPDFYRKNADATTSLRSG